MKRLIFFLCVALSFTSVSFFKIGMAEFTIFHALALLTLFCMVFLAFAKNNLKFRKPPLFFTVIIYLAVVNLAYIHFVKFSSFIYSLIVLLELLLLYNCVKKFSNDEIKKIVKTVIAFYLVNILIASIFIVLNIYPGVLGKIFKIYYFDNRIRPYGFSDEPSYASLILIFSLYVLFKCDNFLFVKSELKWYGFAILTIILTGSSYGFLLLAILLLYFVIKSNIVLFQVYKVLKSNILTRFQLLLFPLVLIVAIGFFINRVDLANNTSIRRLVNLVNSITSSEEEEIAGTVRHIALVDGSASMRLVPTIMLIDEFKNSEIKYVLFGRGAGQSVPFFSKLYEGNTTVLGFIPAFVYNYGLIGVILFSFFFFGLFPRQKTLPIILFTFFVFNADFNTQIFLFVLFTLMLSRQIERNSNPEAKVIA